MIRAGSAVVRRRLSAPAAEVFRWWTEPDLIAQWMTPAGEVTASVDLRVGGSLRVVMKGEGMVIEHTGEFLEVTAPRRLVFTWSSPYTGPRPSLVTVDFQPERDDTTTVVIVHSGLPEAAADPHQGGWKAMLGRLEQALKEADGE